MEITLSSTDDTKKLAEMLASRARCGDVVTLAGDLGAGKTTFAQYFIRALSPNTVEVTSPTFTLLQTYPVALADGMPCELYHYDLYRIEHDSALAELGIEEAVSQLALIEWPECATSLKLPVSLALHFVLGKDGERRVSLSGNARFMDALA